MADFNRLWKVYYRMRKNKRNSADSVEFELHWQRNLLCLRNQLNNHTLQPTAYTFISHFPRPREVWACSMDLRIIHHYLDGIMRSLIEARLTSRTYNNRVGMGLNAAIKQLVTDIYDKSHGYTRDAWVVTWDLQGYFPNARQDLVYQQFEDILLHDYDGDELDDLLYMLRVSVFSYPTRHCTIKSTPEERKLIKPSKSLFTKPDGIGGAIGHLLWQNAMNLYIIAIDKWLQEECGLLHIRYVDDNACVTDNKESFLSYVMPRLRDMYAEYGCTLHPHKFYCQHISKGVRFCGQTVKMQRVYMSKKIERRFKLKVSQCNRSICESKVLHTLSSLNSYLGICKNCNGYAVARRCLDRLSPAWRQYVEFNKSRMCMEAVAGHKTNDRIKHKFNLKLHHYDKRRKIRITPAA